MKSFAAGGLGGIVLGAAMTALAAGSATAGTISIGHTIWVGYGPLYLARDLGYFKDEGVDVQLQVVDDSTLAMAAQAGGKLDGTAVTIDEIIKYRSEADCFKAVAVLDESHGGDGMVATDKVNSIADLKGQTVGDERGLDLAVLVLLSPQEERRRARRRRPSPT